MDGVVDAVADAQGATEGSFSFHDDVSDTTSQSYVTVEDEHISKVVENGSVEEIPVRDESSSATSQDERHPDPSDLPQTTKFEIVLRSLPPTVRYQYEEVHSDVVEAVLSATAASRGERFSVQFTDGTRRDSMTLTELEALENGVEALGYFKDDLAGPLRKRKHSQDDGWDSGSNSQASDPMDIDEDEEDDDIMTRRRSRRQRQATRSAIYSSNNALETLSLSSKSHGSFDSADEASSRPRRSSRALRPRQSTTNYFASQSLARGQDEHADGDDGDFLPVISDIQSGKRPRRGHNRQSRRKHAKTTRRRLSDSDIEFEEPRRSSRATRNMKNMEDENNFDDDSLYVVGNKAPAVPKVVSVKENFPVIPQDSTFAKVHVDTCIACRSSNQRGSGQLIYCQGCTFAYHKHCIGPRSARDHVSTKVGQDHFVLQCRFCVEFHRRKDNIAPQRAICQSCKSHGSSCPPFSEKKTSRQEEKLREENGGVDPTIPVDAGLLNNPENLLFRCLTCYRAWHLNHLPRIRRAKYWSDVEHSNLEDYSIDWQCNECAGSTHKIQRLVAWRYRDGCSGVQTPTAFASVDEDDKQYLVKWEDLSYFHCSWMPGAWVSGTASGAMRSAFAKRASEINLFKVHEKDAIPEEYLKIDIVFRIKIARAAVPGTSIEGDLENVSEITKALVKFQGLGYEDVVWDEPPSKDSGELYDAFVAAYKDYLAGKYFRHDSRSKMRERVKEFKDEPFEEVNVQPAGIKRGKLMGYQLEGLNWLLGNYHQGRNVVLADEMGLGKTVQVISLISYLVQEQPKCWPFLVTVPNATCPNWRREFKQWAPDLRVVTYHGGKESQDTAYKYELFTDGSRSMNAHVVIMSYDSAQDPRTARLFSSVHWAGLVVDEGQRLKNDQNLLYLALAAMKIPFRLLLTGTPLQNNKRELFNLLQFIDRTQDAQALDREFEVLDKETLPKLHDKIRPYFLRRTKLGVLKFLPAMAQIILPVTMTVVQEKLSKNIMAKNPQLIKAMFANDKINRKERGSLNNILMQLRKCLCHPFVYSDAIEERHHDSTVLHRNLVEASAKLLLLELMLPRLKERGHRVLIFSQFLQQLDIIEDFLGGLGYLYRRLDGSMSSMEKQRHIDAYNAPDSPIFAFILSTRAGGVGINLATADTVIIMDPDFNPHQDLQALSRAHRIGQKNKVLCFQLMTKDTVEEKIMQVGRKKMALDHALIESMDDDEIAGDDLESILMHGAQALFSNDYQKKAIHYDGPAIDKLLDRSQVEQTETDDDDTGETQFSYAKVWSNDKASLEDGLAIAEDEAPEPISSSVWDSIIAQREEEARRLAEANRETLGRGGRRRTAINYKTLTAELTQVPEGTAPSSDSSDEFAAGDSPDETDEDDLAGKEDGSHDFDTIQTDRRPVQNVDPNKSAPQIFGGRQASNTFQKAHISTSNESNKKAGKRAEANTHTPGDGPLTPDRLKRIKTLFTKAPKNQSQSSDSSAHSRKDERRKQLINRSVQVREISHRPKLKVTNLGRKVTADRSTKSIGHGNNPNYSEAQLRLEMDDVQHATHLNPDIRLKAISVLRSRLKELDDATDADTDTGDSDDTDADNDTDTDIDDDNEDDD